MRWGRGGGDHVGRSGECSIVLHGWGNGRWECISEIKLRLRNEWRAKGWDSCLPSPFLSPFFLVIAIRHRDVTYML